jgi:transcription elongation GreA/GreB family factor
VSVAFRRESDDEHMEPKFERPIPPGPNLVTEHGLKLIEQRVAEFETKVADMPAGEALDDARRDLRYWRQRLATAQIAPAPAEDEIGFGSRVTIRLNGKTKTLQIVGDDEAHPAAGLLALSAPLAQALIGAVEGEVLPFGGREDAIEVVSIGN